MSSRRVNSKHPLAQEFTSSGFAHRQKVPIDAHLVQITGPDDKFLRLIEQVIGEESKIMIVPSKGGLDIYGKDKDVMEKAAAVLRDLRNREKQRSGSINEQVVKSVLHHVSPGASEFQQAPASQFPITPRNEHQRSYLEAMTSADTVFSAGPAGTGKSFLSMAVALQMLKTKKVEKILLTRPAVGEEELGFLPGDLDEKVGPFMEPLIDAARKVLGNATAVTSMIEKGQIQFVPFAVMRGRNFDNAFVVLDEAQNTTKPQMKMFLSRLGDTSRMVIDGDLGQSDLFDRRGAPLENGLAYAIKALRGKTTIPFVEFDEQDIVRSKRVKEIMLAFKVYDDDERAVLEAAKESYRRNLPPAPNQGGPSAAPH
jgi:phosphate starvation-inducible PhoH-like protein